MSLGVQLHTGRPFTSWKAHLQREVFLPALLQLTWKDSQHRPLLNTTVNTTEEAEGTTETADDLSSSSNHNRGGSDDAL